MINIFKALPFRSRIPSPRAVATYTAHRIERSTTQTSLPASTAQVRPQMGSGLLRVMERAWHRIASIPQDNSTPDHNTQALYLTLCVFFFSWNLKWKGTNNCLGAAGISNMAHSRVIQPYILVHTQATPVKQWCGQHWMPARFQLALTNGATVTCNIA